MGLVEIDGIAIAVVGVADETGEDGLCDRRLLSKRIGFVRQIIGLVTVFIGLCFKHDGHANGTKSVASD